VAVQNLAIDIQVEPVGAAITKQCELVQFRVRVANENMIGAPGVGDAAGAIVYVPLSTPFGSFTPTRWKVDAVSSAAVVGPAALGTWTPGVLQNSMVAFPAGEWVEFVVEATVDCNATLGTVRVDAFVTPKAGDVLPSPNNARSFATLTVTEKTTEIVLTKTLCGGGTTIARGRRAKWRITITNNGPLDLPVGGKFLDDLPLGVTLLGWRYTSPSAGIVKGTGLPIVAPAIPNGEAVTLFVNTFVSQCACLGPVENCFSYEFPLGYASSTNSRRCVSFCWQGDVQQASPATPVKLTNCFRTHCDPGNEQPIVGEAYIKLISGPDGAYDPSTGRTFVCGEKLGPFPINGNGCWESCDLPRNADMISGACVTDTIPSTKWEVTENVQTLDTAGNVVGSCTRKSLVTFYADETYANPQPLRLIDGSLPFDPSCQPEEDNC
jgi:hypothetical protein